MAVANQNAGILAVRLVLINSDEAESQRLVGPGAH